MLRAEPLAHGCSLCGAYSRAVQPNVLLALQAATERSRLDAYAHLVRGYTDRRRGHAVASGDEPG